MTRLNTPYGEISIKIDGKEITYNYIKSENDEICPNLLGRYFIVLNVEPDGNEHYISCQINPNIKFKSEIETGERYECQTFYNDDRIMLTIGVYGEVLVYDKNGEREYYSFNDYDIEHLNDGMSYIILEDTTTDKYIFGIAWIDDVGYDDPFLNTGHDRANETYFGAEPDIRLLK